MKKDRSKPLMLYVAEKIYISVTKIKKDNPGITLIEAIEMFSTSKEYIEIKCGNFHNQLFDDIKENNYINKETKKIIKDEFIVSDKINIKNGKFFFEKLGSSKIISDKYRKKIKLKQHEDNLEIDGELDLDNDDPSNITIILENKSSHYEGLGILENYEKKTENVKVILTPIN